MKRREKEKMKKFENKILRLSILFFGYHIYAITWFVWLLPCFFFALVGAPELYALSHVTFYFIFGVVLVFSTEYCIFRNINVTTRYRYRKFLLRKKRIYKYNTWF